MRFMQFISNSKIKFLFVICSLFFFYFLLLGSIQPNYSGKKINSNLQAKVKITRGKFAIPRIESTTDEDAYFALGYVHAQDRLWQMQLLKRTIYGELTELFGSKLLRKDRLMRHFMFRHICKENFSKQPLKVKKNLIAYSKGVNQRIVEINSSYLDWGGIEFMLFPHTIPKWEPFDSIAILKLMAFDLTNKANQEIDTFIMGQNLDENQFRDLIPQYNGIHPSQLDLQMSQTTNTIKKSLGASNVWALSPIRSNTSSSIGASDPHLQIAAPIIWYMAGFKIKDQNVFGATIPGIPAFLIGRNNDIAWGMTNVGADDQDLLYINKEHSLNQKEIHTMNETFNISNKDSIQFKNQYTDQGPIIEADLLSNHTFSNDTKFVFQWTALNPNDLTLEAISQVMNAKSMNQAAEKLNLITSPYINLMLMDKNNIALETVGHPPKRSLNHTTKGLLPAPYEKKNFWKGLLSYEQNPKTLNPQDGVVRNTNNQVTFKKYPNNFSFIWADHYRIKRLDELLENKKSFKTSDLKKMQLDFISTKAIKIKELLISYLSKENQSKYHILLSALKEWDGSMDKNRYEPLFYHLWLRNFEKALYEDKFKNNWTNVDGLSPTLTERILSGRTLSAKWLKHIDQHVNETFTITLHQIETKYKSIQNSKWGSEHQAVHRNAVLSHIPLLKYISSFQHPVDGDAETLLRTEFSNDMRHPFYSDQSSGVRVIFDLSRQNTESILSTGESGHVFSMFYGDQHVLWKKGEYVNSSFVNNGDKRQYTLIFESS